MNALDHFRKGEQLLAQSEQTPAGELDDVAVPVNALLVDQARAHFEAARTMIAAINALDMPAHNYEAWEKIALAPSKPAGLAASEFELDECPECETTGRNCAAHGGRPGIPVGGGDRG